MYRKGIAIICLFFSACCVCGQQGKDYYPLFASVASSALSNVTSQKQIAFDSPAKPLSLFIFLSPECPLCQNYSVALRQLKQQYGGQVNFYGVVPGNTYTIDEILAFEKKYETGFNLFIDKSQKLTKYLKASVTPQAIVLNSAGTMVYTGAIDDWVQALGKKRATASQHYLEDAIQQSLQSGEVKLRQTKPVGCKINDY